MITQSRRGAEKGRKVKRFQILLVAVFGAVLGCGAEPEAHVDSVVAEVLANVAKLKAASPDAVPMAFWDFDGTIIKGDIGDEYVQDGKVQYRGLIRDSILAGLCPVYRGEEGCVQWWADYSRMHEIGSWLCQGYDAQMYAGVELSVLEEFCNRRIRECYLRWYFASSVAIWKRLAEAGVENYVVSANVESLMRNVAPTLGIPRSRVRGARVEIEGGRLTTKIVHPIPFGEGKVEAVRQMVLARPNGVVVAGFGNSYSTDGNFLRYIVTQHLPGGAKGFALMINGGRPKPGFEGLFRCVDQSATQGVTP